MPVLPGHTCRCFSYPISGYTQAIQVGPEPLERIRTALFDDASTCCVACGRKSTYGAEVKNTGNAIVKIEHSHNTILIIIHAWSILAFDWISFADPSQPSNQRISYQRLLPVAHPASPLCKLTNESIIICKYENDNNFFIAKEVSTKL